MLRGILQQTRQSFIIKAMTESVIQSSVTLTSDVTSTQNDKGNEEKRSLEEEHVTKHKRQKIDYSEQEPNEEREHVPYKKKKMALMMVYCGKGYFGMQRNPGYKTIESDLIEALVKAGVIRDEHAEKPTQMQFQRAARTDKGVSAAGQVVSLKCFSDVENALEKINSNLPPQIRVLSMKQATKGFDSKNACTGRSYLYLIPTFAFTKFGNIMKEDYRIDEDTHKRINKILAMFKGTHNFHNYTSGKKPNDKSAIRYITHFEMGPACVRQGLEFAVISIDGQSFMMHQIRKMIGITIAIVQNLAGVDVIERSWQPEKCDIPRAPGLGLMLDKCHYKFYNQKFGDTHEKLVWDDLKDEIEKFKEEHIFSTMIETEKEEKSMLTWLGTLHLHTFDNSRREEDYTPGEIEALHRVREARMKEKEEGLKPAEKKSQDDKDCETQGESDSENKDSCKSAATEKVQDTTSNDESNEQCQVSDTKS